MNKYMKQELKGVLYCLKSRSIKRVRALYAFYCVALITEYQNCRTYAGMSES